MTNKVQCHGGPHDGAEVALPLFDFTWVDGKRNYRDPKPGRALYRRVRTWDHRYLLMFVQFAYARCERCEVYHSRLSDACTLCGSPLSVRSDVE